MSILAFFLLRNIRNNRTLCLVALAVSLIVIMLCVYLLPAYHKIWGRVATVWIFILGFIVSSIGLKKWMNEPWVIVVSWLIIILALVDGRFVGCQINEAVNWPLWAPLVFVAGILIAYNVAMIMDGSVVGNIIGFIGDFSFSIMAFHFIGFNLVNYSRSLFFDGVNVSAFPIDISDFYYWMPVYFLVGIAFPILLSLSYAKTKQAIKNRISILDNNHIV